ncbi:MAG: class I SAM-dependent methyltransferase [Aquaticitalea sp.]
MNFIKQYVVDLINIHRLGKKVYSDSRFKETNRLTKLEIHKTPRRTEIINHFVTIVNAQSYLEIGVRDPKKNFNRIECKYKISVDPGVEFEENPVDYKMTSDDFFQSIRNNESDLDQNIKFDVIYIDGLHISDQVERDILNGLDFLSPDGVMILHDCNPPTEFHQREQYDFMNSPARSFWNGTTWKAFYKYRHDEHLFSICFDTDWGVGVISKKQYPLFDNIKNRMQNEFYEFSVLNTFRSEHLNLHSFKSWMEEK